jgi:Zn-dependent M16 (insulinase) family peptidase
MNLEKNRTYHGFLLKDERQIREINSLGRIFLHEKSGARLLHFENEDDNKVFSVSFRTPPHDSSGIPHILEHSVLCGSRKFPSKEPFVELVKGSLNTFLNAFTFPDKTMYPVASRNSKDFFNLVNVYLDAVLYPNIYEYPEIFMQEGWHYEINSIEERIQYKGVVYNEMKGVFSSPESVLFRKIPESLFPDTCYGVESGGDPDVIPKLTRDVFLDFHKKYYHPSNGYFYIYGDVNILDLLGFLNESYLKDYDRIEVDSHIRLQDPFSRSVEVKTQYPISPDESEEDKTYLSSSFVVGKATDRKLYFAFDILEYLLLETPAAPLKKALIDAELGKDVFGQFEPSMVQPVFSIVVKNSNRNKAERFKTVVHETLRRLVREGIDKKLIEASINIKEFRLREADFRGFPKGLVYCIQSMDSWLYDSDPFVHLEYEPALKEIKKALTNRYLEGLIERYILDNSHCAHVIVEPQKGLTEKKEREIEKQLSQYKETLSRPELKELVKKTETLKKRQTTPDPPESLRAIPLLTLQDIDPKAEELPQEIREEGKHRILFHPLFTSRIAYIDLFFDIHVPQEDLPYCALLSQVLGKVSTEHYHYAELANEINIHTGGISFMPETFGDKADDGLFYPKFMVRAKSLVTKLPDLGSLLSEIIGHTRFDEKKRLKEIIREAKSRMEMSIYQNGHVIASSRLLSYFSPIGHFTESLSGLSLYRFIADLERTFEQKQEMLIAKLQDIARILFRDGQLSFSVTAEESDYAPFLRSIPKILESLGRGESTPISYRFEKRAKNEGLLTPGKVQYVAQGYNFKKLGYRYSGTLQVLRSIASMDYLWNRVRVQGGAYGSFARFSRNGNMYFCSYRDPNLKKTLGVYRKAGDYLRSFFADTREMTKYIIGTISKLDAPLTPSMKGEVATQRYFSNITQEDIQCTRDEVLGTGTKDIAQYAEMIEDVMNQQHFCVIGSEPVLRENSTLFNELISVFNG